jgi:hypothetical protein
VIKHGTKETRSHCEEGKPILCSAETVGGERKWIVGGNTVKDAQVVLNENLEAAEDGTFKDIEKTTFREFGKI